MIGRVNTGGGTGATLTVTAPASPNLITFPSDSIPNGATISGITFTAVDGYYEFNGTATNDLWLRIHSIGTDAPFELDTEYSIIGAPEGSNIDKFVLAVTNGLGYWKYDTGSGATFTFSEISESKARVEIEIIKGTTLEHVVFRPKLQKVNAGCTVTVSKDGKTKTKTAGADGVAVFRGLASGEWTISITDGEQTAQKTVTITADYSTAITFFSATIHITYPKGSTCTATDGTTTLTAPDTRGTWECVVPNAGTWTVSLNSGFSEKVTITSNGDTKTLDKWHLYNRGNECSAVTGGWGAKNFGYYWDTESSDNITSITKNSGSMVITNVSGSKVGVAGTKNKVDISKYSKLSVLYSSTGNDTGRALAVLPTRQANIGGSHENTAAKKLLSSGTNATGSVDLTGIADGSYYIAVTVDKQPSCTIYEVYLKT